MVIMNRWLCKAWCLLVLWLSWSTSSSIATIALTCTSFPSTEYSALQDLYLQTDGDSWIWTSIAHAWNFSSLTNNPCLQQWEGLTCINTTSTTGLSTCHIATLNLADHNLNGPLPSSLTAMSFLTSLLLTSNFLIGKIPSNLNQFNRMQKLDLSENRMTGTVPVSISQMTSLTLLDLNRNELTGKLPDFWHVEMQLVDLYLYDNHFTGTIPSSFASLLYVQYMDLSGNQLNGTLCEALSEMPSLTTLVLTYNQLTGTLPPSFGTKMLKIAKIEITHNLLVGVFPEAWCLFPKLSNLALSNNMLSGTLPRNISKLVNMQFLFLTANHFQHRIPDSIGNMPSLRSILFDNNSFTGPLPSTIQYCTLMYYLNLNYNLLTGTIPNVLSLMTTLKTIALNNNFFSGTLSEGIIKLPLLTYISMEDNLLTGTIPAVIASNKKLITVMLRQNQFTGTLPSTLLDLPRIQLLAIDSNQLTGKLPSVNNSPTSPTNGKSLLGFILSSNYFSGTIPSTLGYFTNLYLLMLGDNCLYGSIPTTLTSHHVVGLFLASNALTGTIPLTLKQAIKLQEVYVYNNFLTGTVPWEVFSVSNLTVLNVAENQLHGTISSYIGNFRNLIELNVSSNRLTGTLPGSFQHLQNILAVDLSNNKLSGDLHNKFDLMINLTTLLLQNNVFSGDIIGSSFLQTDKNVKLDIIDLSTNQLTSTLPASIFQLPALTIFNVAKNCMTGSIPLSICESPVLTTLLLDGLHAQCEAKIFVGTNIDTFRMVDSVEGGIPACLFQMQSLQTLHVSGNGIYDTLPSDIKLSSVLQDLILSHNQLKGTIPEIFQERSWKTLDLSFNRLTGTLMDELLVAQDATVANTSSITSSASLNLQVNRLSGIIPDSIKNLIDINILDGNIFACDISRSSLPAHDPHKDSYHCGSDDINRPLFIIIAITVIIAFLWLNVNCSTKPLVFEGKRDQQIDTATYWQFLLNCYSYAIWNIKSDHAINTENIYVQKKVQKMYLDFQHLRHGFFAVTVFAMIILIPLYVTMSYQYSPYEHQYVWLLSIAYMTGIPPAITLLFVFSMFLSILIYIFVFFKRQYETDLKNTSQSPASTSTSTNVFSNAPKLYDRLLCSCRCTWQFVQTKWFRYALIIGVADMAVVMVIYMSYIYSTVQQVDVETLLFLSFLVSIFKLVWNVRFLMQYARGLLEHHKQDLEVFYPSVEADTSSRTVVVTNAKHHALQNEFILFMMIFNNIIAPVLSVLFISPNCFYYTLVSSPLVTSAYGFAHCYSYNVIIVGVVPSKLTCSVVGTDSHATSYYPSYSYNYQCSSSLLSGFVDIFLYRYILSTISPFIMLFIKFLQEQYHQRGNTKFADRLLHILPLILQPSEEKEEEIAEERKRRTNEASQSRMTETISQASADSSSTMNPLAKNSEASFDDVTTSTSTSTSASPQSWWNRFMKEDFSKDSFVIILLGDAAVLLTFGILFPPIAIIVCMSVYMQTWYHQYTVGRFLSIATKSKATTLKARMTVVLEEITGLVDAMHPSLFLLLMIAVSTWAFFLYDTLGDDVGGRSAVGILLAMCCMPFLLWLIIHVLFENGVFGSNLKKETVKEDKDNIELESFSN